MNAARLLYRTRQFWQALGSEPSLDDIDQARAMLTPPQMALFLQMQPSEQAHSLGVFMALQAHQAGAQAGYNRDLLVAALLHDAGKSRFSLHLWERVLIVLGKAFFPRQAARWGRAPITHGGPLADGSAGADQLDLPTLRRAFIIAEQHPRWGAQMAAAAGASPLTVAVIRKHQDALPPAAAGDMPLEERLLRALQAIDDKS